MTWGRSRRCLHSTNKVFKDVWFVGHSLNLERLQRNSINRNWIRTSYYSRRLQNLPIREEHVKDGAEFKKDDLIVFDLPPIKNIMNTSPYAGVNG
ncbi:hypothetical protein YC2023_093339 [Brassica napus]